MVLLILIMQGFFGRRQLSDVFDYGNAWIIYNRIHTKNDFLM